LLVLRGTCHSGKLGPAGTTEFLLASDAQGVRSLGSVEACCSGLVFAEFGCAGKVGLEGVTSVAIWQRMLGDVEVLNAFLWDGLRLGCVTDSEVAFLRSGKRPAPLRSPDEQKQIKELLEAARDGQAPCSTLDLTDLKISDADLPVILDAVSWSFDGVSALLLCNCFITEVGVLQHILPFLSDVVGPFRLDLSGNSDIHEPAEAPLLEVVTKKPACRVHATGTRFSNEAVETLLNVTKETQEAVRQTVENRRKTAEMSAAFDAAQQELESRWAEQRDPPVTSEAEEAPAEKAPSAFAKFPDGKIEQLKELRAELASKASRLYDRAGGYRFEWGNAGGRPPQNCGSGQFMAHFSYLAYSVELRPPSDFTLRLRKQKEAFGGPLGLHTAVEKGTVLIEAASGKSYGRDALTLKLRNTTSAKLSVAVPAGAIFEHISWIHHQNLLVGRTVHFHLEPGEVKEQRLGAHCMNQSCACADHDSMYLTSLVCEDEKLLQSQAVVWQHFEGLFDKYKDEAGFGKKKKGGKKKK